MSFDWLAPHYRWMEAVLAGTLLQRARTRWLGELRGRGNLLIVGEGPGRTLEVICRDHPQVSITVVEMSAAMVAVAKGRLAKNGISAERVTWVQADVRAWLEERDVVPEMEKGRRFDAVLTPCVLDCFSPEDVRGVIEGIAREVSKDAIWLVVDFCVPERGWTRLRGRAVHALMYAFFRMAARVEARRLTPPDDALRAAGFSLRGRAFFSAGLVHSDVWWRVPGS